jgi:hypothetical protein
MIHSFNKYQEYFNTWVVFILKIVIQTPQFNNYVDICELFDIYIRKNVMNKSKFSSKIKKDCFEMIEFFYDIEYINHIKSTFDFEDDAYHYLSILFQFQRMSNRYKLSSLSPYHHFNPANIQKMIDNLDF